MAEDQSALEVRQREERIRKIAQIKQMLDQPGGGSDEVAKKLGKSALGSDEYKIAQRQRQAAQVRRREAAEARARDARQRQSAAQTAAAVPQRTRQEMVNAQKGFAQRPAEKAAEQAKIQARARSQAQSM